MKDGNSVIRESVSRDRKSDPARRPCTITVLCFLIVAATSLVLAVTGGCKKRQISVGDAKKDSVSSGETQIGYSDINHQKVKFQEFRAELDSRIVSKEPYGLLRQMMEKVPLQYVEGQLTELSRGVSPQDKPNVFLLLERIGEMRNLDDPAMSTFVQRAKDEGNIEKLNVAIFGLPTEKQQAEAAEALASLGKAESVRLLTVRLYNAAASYAGGSEAKISREQLRRSIVVAIGACTGMDVSNYDPASAEQTDAVVNRAKEWLDTRKEEMRER